MAKTYQIALDLDGCFCNTLAINRLLEGLRKEFPETLDLTNPDCFSRITDLWTEALTQTSGDLLDTLVKDIKKKSIDSVRVFSGSARQNADMDKCNAMQYSKFIVAEYSKLGFEHAMSAQLLQLFSTPFLLSVFSNALEECIADAGIPVTLCTNLASDTKKVDMSKGTLFDMLSAFSSPGDVTVFIDDLYQMTQSFHMRIDSDFGPESLALWFRRSPDKTAMVFDGLIEESKKTVDSSSSVASLGYSIDQWGLMVHAYTQGEKGFPGAQYPVIFREAQRLEIAPSGAMHLGGGGAAGDGPVSPSGSCAKARPTPGAGGMRL